MTTPKKIIFEEMKAAAISICKTYEGKFVDDKLSFIETIKNSKDNAMVFYRMFDYENQAKMRSKLSQESIDYINKH